MNPQKISIALLLVFTVVFSSCSPGDIQNKIEVGAKDAKLDMKKEYARARVDFDKAYLHAFENAKDSAAKRRLENFKLAHINTMIYLDSLKLLVDNDDLLDEKDQKKVTRLFINLGLADSVFHKLDAYYSLAEAMALTANTKSNVADVRENAMGEKVINANERKELYFSTGSFGAFILLNDLQQEAFKADSLVLAEY